MVDYAATEEEQIEAIKLWWKTYGLVVLWGVIFISAVYLGWQYWSQHQQRYREQASQQFMVLLQAIEVGNTSDSESHLKVLKERYRRTVYSDMASLIVARSAVEIKDYEAAKAHLKWIIHHQGGHYPYVQLAQIRLARLLMEENAFEAALKIIDAIDHREGYETMIDEIKGDILNHQEKTEAAVSAYESAIEHAPDGLAQRPWLNMKFEDLKKIDGSAADEQ
jgi:predicted negative regulator of RcsB-dependent stress response